MMVILGIAIALSCVVVAARPTEGPHLALSWSANVVQEYPAATKQGAAKGTFFHDTRKQRWRMSTCAPETIFHPDDHMCTNRLAKNISSSGLNMNMTFGNGANAVCMVVPSSYYDMLFLELMPLAKHQGVKTVDGERCEIWAVFYKSRHFAVNVSTCIAADGAPREHNVSSSIAFKMFGDGNFHFSNVSVAPLSDDVFAPTEVCTKRYPMPPCSDSGVKSLDLYRVRSAKEPNSLLNRNLGDALGDMAFFCGVGGMDETQVVTHWSAQASSSWGQYAHCLYLDGNNTCFGSSGKQVGRESALGLGKGSAAVQGQCTPNQDVGSWFSFPTEGVCPDGAQVGDQGCTWTAKPLRTVSAACILNDRGLKASCANERGHAPLTKSAAIFKAALESSDPAEGGCPDVPAADATSTFMLVV